MTGSIDFRPDGLVPAIVQDDVTGQVLMLGYFNEASLAETRSSGLVTFWSRTRQELWQKGAISGNSLAVVDIAVDCDADALLITAHPSGPTCHTGAVSCFSDVGRQGFAWLEELWGVIAERAASPVEGSYTSQLIGDGVDAVGRKVTEEATEVLIAAKDHADSGGTEALAAESADLIYHLLVLLAERGVNPRQVVDELRRRRSGNLSTALPSQ